LSAAADESRRNARILSRFHCLFSVVRRSRRAAVAPSREKAVLAVRGRGL